MRNSCLLPLAGAAFALFAPPALAQKQAEPTVEGYLCTFAGKCGDAPATEVPTRPAPATKGFRIARPGSEAPSASTPRTTSRNASAARAARPARYNSVSRANRAAAPVYGAGRAISAPRADLMIGFELNSAQITADGLAKARVFAQSLLMPELRSKRFLIEGHTDARGGIPLNMELSRRRAQAVADFLSAQGVERSRIQVRGFGPSTPIPGHSASDPRNRRVEAKLIS